LSASAGAGSADAIIVAAGSSARMGGPDKLLLDVGGRPLLAHTLAALAAAPEVATLVVVTTPDRRRTLDAGGWLPTDRQIVFAEGGQRRHDSVRAGFEALERSVPDPAGERVALVHDGARPLVSAELVRAVVNATVEHGAAIPVVPIADTLKRVIDGRIETTVDRSALAAAQTPQGVRRGILRRALAAPEAAAGDWTDEAALLEACRIAVHVVPGDRANLKVTVPADVGQVARSVAPPAAMRRTGIGHDSHPFGPQPSLRLGGIDIAAVPRLHGHSDGDVLLHAIADGALGAAGLGDLGRWFPAGQGTPAGIDSRVLVTGVVERLADAGWIPVAVDATIVAARPRLASHLAAMGAAIGDLLGLDRGAVNIKASSGNLAGPEGAGRSISALALVTIEQRR
jgi:2-C-methyl-D-erythritol 4-phosphate cytidylyltransferase/2-C-methyl-D-erythritol 2,4-cyclodiphosphate synthase